jgi:uncharacterized membrane-anchored protein YhcB (DUF1043 family)
MKPPYLTVALSTGIFLLGGCSVVNQVLSAKSTQDSASTESQSASDNLTDARQLAWEAAVIVQNPPHPVNTWQQAKGKWQQAVALLEAAPINTTISAQIREKLPVYRANYTTIDRRLAIEQSAANNLQKAQDLAWQAAVVVQNPPHALRVWRTASRHWQDAIVLLEKIPKTTFAFATSQEKLSTYRNNYSTINQHVATETSALIALKQFSETAVQLNNLMTSRLINPTQSSVGISYQDYSRTVQEMEASLAQFTNQPDVKKHLIYSDLTEAVEDHKLVLKLWQTYLDFKKAETQNLDNDSFNQLFPISFQESNLLIQKYGVRTYGNGTQVSLKFTIWAIWQRANQHIRQAQQKILSLS